MAPAILLLVLAGCHGNYNGALYEYQIACQGSEPATFTDTLEQVVYARVWASGYMTIEVKQRHKNMILEEHEWTEQVGSGCVFHKKFLGMAEPVGNDG